MNKKIKALIGIIFCLIILAGCSQRNANRELPVNTPTTPVSERSEASEPILKKPESVKIPNLVYHSVRPTNGRQDIYEITPESFEKQLKYLVDNGYTAVSYSDLDKFLNGKELPPEKPVIINFDDGLDSQYEYAWPLIKKYNIKATFFFYTNPLGRKNFMTWDQAKEIADAGMEIGNHTRYHPYLTKIIDPNELEQEIDLSRKKLEEYLGVTIDIFAYPFGLSDTRIEKVVKDYGYIFARGLRHDVIVSEDDRYDLNGFIVTNSFESFQKILE